MQPLLEEILRHTDAGARVALCTVVGSHGSTPQEKGAKMLVLRDGRTVGTLGGGCVEAEVRKVAIELLERDQSKLMEFSLDHDYGWDDGLICGGVMEIFIQTIDAARSQPYRDLLNAMRQNRTGLLKIDYEQAGACKHYLEELGPPPTLVIAGAGHVGQALADLAAKLDFRVTVIDDRADYASAERFPTATRRIVGDIETNLRDFAIDASTYVVIVTRGHRNDGKALATVINSPAQYLGLIGSKAKIKLIYDDLVASGVEPQQLLRVHAPIGYEIGAVTVPEIAVSIAAELVAVRRGRDNKPAPPMKMDEAQLRAWLSRVVTSKS